MHSAGMKRLVVKMLPALLALLQGTLQFSAQNHRRTWIVAKALSEPGGVTRPTSEPAAWPTDAHGGTGEPPGLAGSCVSLCWR